MPCIEVFVAAQDIEEGRRHNSWRCPLCLALWRATGMKWVVELHEIREEVPCCGYQDEQVPVSVHRSGHSHRHRNRLQPQLD